MPGCHMMLNQVLTELPVVQGIVLAYQKYLDTKSEMF